VTVTAAGRAAVSRNAQRSGASCAECPAGTPRSLHHQVQAPLSVEAAGRHETRRAAAAAMRRALAAGSVCLGWQAERRCCVSASLNAEGMVVARALLMKRRKSQDVHLAEATPPAAAAAAFFLKYSARAASSFLAVSMADAQSEPPALQ